MLAKAVIISALSYASAASIRVALYAGNGTSAVSRGNYTNALTQLVATAAISSFKALEAGDVAGLSASDFDCVIFPGGGGGSEAAAIGASGSAAVQAFVKTGGKGYIGTCAGGYLAGHDTCCAVSIPGYCNDRVGCYQVRWISSRK
jgi:glutamine amidotransferase-like uncharacterized protein